jgi:hypothetical protein
MVPNTPSPPGGLILLPVAALIDLCVEELAGTNAEEVR